MEMKLLYFLSQLRPCISSKLLVSQYRLQFLPGWNAAMGRGTNIIALCHGRVMITTERVMPNPEVTRKLYKDVNCP